MINVKEEAKKLPKGNNKDIITVAEKYFPAEPVAEAIKLLDATYKKGLADYRPSSEGLIELIDILKTPAISFEEFSINIDENVTPISIPNFERNLHILRGIELPSEILIFIASLYKEGNHSHTTLEMKEIVAKKLKLELLVEKTEETTVEINPEAMIDSIKDEMLMNEENKKGKGRVA